MEGKNHNNWNTCKRAQTPSFLTLMMLSQTDRWGRQEPSLKAEPGKSPSLLAVPTLKSKTSLGGLSHALYTSLHQSASTGCCPCCTGGGYGRSSAQRRWRSSPILRFPPQGLPQLG